MLQATQGSRILDVATRTVAATLAVAWLLPATAAKPDTLRARIDALWSEPRPTIEGRPVYRIAALRKAYEALRHAPVWTAPDQSSDLEGLLETIEGVDDDGLVPADYHLGTLRRLQRRAPSSPALELLASDAFLQLAAHLAWGKARSGDLQRPPPASGDWHRIVDALRVAAGPASPEGALADLRPPAPEYAGLQQRLRELERLARHEPAPLDRGPALQPGDRGDRVGQLRRRLSWLGDLEAPPREADDRDHYDTALVRAVRGFQARHGLAADAIVGPRTRGALNRTAPERIERLRVNLERLRWLPPARGDERIAVNIADFRLRHVARGDRPMTMRAIVGERYSQTPVLDSTVQTIVVNPAWHVPRKIAVEQFLPRLKRDPAALERRGFVAVPTGDDTSPRALAPTDVDWSRYGADFFPFRLRQAPGPGNALGRVQFRFPNRYSVFLHDTPSRHLFARDERTFSHGCIRLERAAALAERLLADAGGERLQRFRNALESGRPARIGLAEPVPIQLQYLTAWAEDGTVHYRDDVYGRDHPLLRALARDPRLAAR